MHDKPYIQKWVEGDASHRKALQAFLDGEIALRATEEPLQGEGEACIYEADFGRGTKERKAGIFASSGTMFLSFTKHGCVTWLLTDIATGERLPKPLRFESCSLWDVRNLIRDAGIEEDIETSEALAELEEMLADHETLIRNNAADIQKTASKVYNRHTISVSNGEYYLCFEIINRKAEAYATAAEVIADLPRYDEGMIPCRANHISIIGVCRPLDGGGDHLQLVAALNADGTPMTATNYYFGDGQFNDANIAII